MTETPYGVNVYQAEIDSAGIDLTSEMLPSPGVDGIIHRYITTRDGCPIHVAEAGSGAPLVLIHGWPQHWYAWRAVIAPLAETFRVICPDVRGLGWSHATGSDWRLSRLADDIIDVMDFLAVDDAGIVGHDWGAAISYQLGLDHPQRVSRLMPLAGLHPWAAIGLHPRTVWRPWHVYTAAVLGSLNNTWLQMPRISLQTWRHVGAFTPAEIEIYCSSMRLPRALRATTQYYRNILTREVPFFWRHAKDITLSLPVLHLNGSDDPLTRRLSDAYRGHAPNMNLIDLPNCGHFIAEERPAQLIDHITEFFGP